MTADEFEQKWPNHLVILRHGQSEKNLAKQQAQEAGSHSTFGSGLRDADEPLTDKGRVQARATGMFLASHYAFDAVFTSPYLRTLQTTEEVLKAFAISPSLVREERLREIEF